MELSKNKKLREEKLEYIDFNARGTHILCFPNEQLPCNYTFLTHLRSRSNNCWVPMLLLALKQIHGSLWTFLCMQEDKYMFGKSFTSGCFWGVIFCIGNCCLLNIMTCHFGTLWYRVVPWRSIFLFLQTSTFELIWHEMISCLKAMHYAYETWFETIFSLMDFLCTTF